jgi:hypothetical protein
MFHRRVISSLLCHTVPGTKTPLYSDVPLIPPFSESAKKPVPSLLCNSGKKKRRPGKTPRRRCLYGCVLYTFV